MEGGRTFFDLFDEKTATSNDLDISSEELNVLSTIWLSEDKDIFKYFHYIELQASDFDYDSPSKCASVEMDIARIDYSEDNV